ncbi:hypothetical protein OIU76_008001 [Salix suchowensis]|nr:hypothetical protein OIU78_011421 [Salix suchowensis]KAJ6338441.1 hypothetical protein OIU76_008001 [Salix suchowensis]
MPSRAVFLTMMGITVTPETQARKVLFHFNQEELKLCYARADVVDMLIHTCESLHRLECSRTPWNRVSRGRGLEGIMQVGGRSTKNRSHRKPPRSQSFNKRIQVGD